MNRVQEWLAGKPVWVGSLVAGAAGALTYTFVASLFDSFGEKTFGEATRANVGHAGVAFVIWFVLSTYFETRRRKQLDEEQRL